MKKSIVLISLLIMLPLGSNACGPFPRVHNYYMMNVVGESNSPLASPDFITPLTAYWKSYTGLKEGFFDDDCKLIVEAAKLKKDAELCASYRQISAHL